MSEEIEVVNNAGLTEEERVICMQVATTQSPFIQRAKAILALADGVIIESAALQSGLTVNQVKYWQRRFDKNRVAIFPPEVLNPTTTMVEPGLGASSEQESVLEGAPSPVAKKTKKTKKNKDKKKDKKDKEKKEKEKKGKDKKKKDKKKKTEKKEKKGGKQKEQKANQKEE